MLNIKIIVSNQNNFVRKLPIPNTKGDKNMIWVREKSAKARSGTIQHLNTNSSVIGA